MGPPDLELSASKTMCKTHFFKKFLTGDSTTVTESRLQHTLWLTLTLDVTTERNQENSIYLMHLLVYWWVTCWLLPSWLITMGAGFRCGTENILGQPHTCAEAALMKWEDFLRPRLVARSDKQPGAWVCDEAKKAALNSQHPTGILPDSTSLLLSAIYLTTQTRVDEGWRCPHLPACLVHSTLYPP